MSSGLCQVVVTGAALASPAGYTLAENYTAWREGRSNFGHITSFNAADSSVRFAGECPPPDYRQLPDRKVQKILRRKDVISLLTTLAAAKDAGLNPGDVDPERFGMYVGAPATQIGDLTPYFTLVARCADPAAGTFDSELFGAQMLSLVNPLVVLQTLMNNGLCFGTMTLDLRGVNANFMDFQVAGLRAVGEAWRSIADGRADAVIAGGIAAPVEPFQLAAGVRSGFLARTAQLDVPLHTVVKPYDRQRCGTILSEGSAYVVLEEERQARRRGARILGRIGGFGLASDGVFDLVGAQRAPGLVRAMQGALQQAGLAAGDLGCMIGHGCGAIHADAAEAEAYVAALGEAAGGLPLMSPKAVLGDLCEAGGVVALILALESLARREIPATFNFDSAAGAAAQLSLQAAPQAVGSAHALVTARNFLGLSAALQVSAA